MPATGRAMVFLSDFGYRNEWAEGLGSVSPGDPIWLTAARD
jgi:hypothetical protein